MTDLKQKNYGLIISRPEVGDWVLGAASLPSYATSEILQENMNWKPYLPIEERQNKFVETMGCVSFGTLNAVEALLNRKYDLEVNYSDRFLAKVSDTTRNGNSPHRVGETLRKVGVVNEKEWDFTQEEDSWDTFYAQIPPKLYQNARIWNETYDFKHYYVPGTKDGIKDALRFSPVGISVSAWTQSNGIYDQRMPENHFTLCYGFDDEKNAWKVYDSYDNHLKLYTMDAKISIAKGYYVRKATQRQSYWCRKWGILCS